jgi:hypothetical protein
MTKKYIYKNQESLWGESECIGFGTDEFYVKEIDRKLANEIIIKNHYSKKVYNGTYIHLGVFYKNNLKNRMWIDDDCKQYAESQAISYSVKYIKKKLKKIKWIQSFADERCGGFGIVYQACSFDYFGEHTNKFWELDGETFHNSIMTSEKAGRRGYNLLNNPDNKDRIIKHELRQFRYIKFIDKREKKNCLLKQKPYLKHYKND